jgi:hypothetical protein
MDRGRTIPNSDITESVLYIHCRSGTVDEGITVFLRG